MPLMNAIPLPAQAPTDLRLRLAAALERPIERQFWLFAWELDIPLESVQVRRRAPHALSEKRRALARYIYEWANGHGFGLTWPEVALLFGTKHWSKLMAREDRRRRGAA